MELVNHLKTTFDSKAAVLVCLFFVGVVNIPGAGELVLALIAVLGIAFTIKHRINPLTDPDLKLFSWLVLAVVGSKLLSILVNEPGPRTYGNLGTSIHFLLAPFVATYLCKERWNKGSPFRFIYNVFRKRSIKNSLFIWITIRNLTFRNH